MSGTDSRPGSESPVRGPAGHQTVTRIVRRLRAKPWQVVRQTSSQPDQTVCVHRLNWPAEIHARWLQRHGSRADRAGAETTQDLEQAQFGVFYTARRAPELAEGES